MLAKLKCCIATAKKEDYELIYRAPRFHSGAFDCGKWVKNGESFLPAISNDRTQIAIVDACLPGFDIFESLAIVKTQKPLQVIMIAPAKDFDLAYKALKIQACELLVRPFTVDQVNDALQMAAVQALTTVPNMPRRESSRNAFVNHMDTVLDGRTTADDINHIYSTQFQDGLYRVVTFAVDLPDTSLLAEMIRQFWHFIRSFLDAKLMGHIYELVHALVYNEIRIALNYPSENETLVLQSLQEALAYVQNICKSVPNAEIYMGLGRSYPDINKLITSSAESKASIWTRMANTTDPKKIFRFSNNQKLSDNDLELIINTETGLRKSMDHLNLSSFCMIVETFFQLPDSVLCTPQAKDAILRPVRYFYTTYREKINTFTSASSFYYSTKLSLLTSRSFNEYKSRYLSCFTPMFERLLSTIDTAQHISLDRAKEYINHSYMHEITLERVAEEVMLNPSYLSRLFRQHTGHTFTDYCLQQRLNAAKMLLQRTNYRIKEVSHAIGFDDQHYFARVFHKNVGLTPTAYRKAQKLNYTTEENYALPD